MDQQGRTASEDRPINTQHLRNAIDQLRTIVTDKKYQSDLPTALFNDLTNIHSRLLEACGWTAEKAAGVGGASGR